MKQITISLKTIRVVIHTVNRARCVSNTERPFAVKRSSRQKAEFVLGFLTGINRVLKALFFLNRTPKAKLANEAAAGGEGPPHTPALGATPSPGPAAGKPGEAI